MLSIRLVSPALCVALATLSLHLGAAPAAWAQSGGIEIFAGETLFAEGTRVSLTGLQEVKGTLRSGSHRVNDPLNRKTIQNRTVLGLDHGVAQQLTLSALLPWVQHRGHTIAGNVRSEGAGDAAVLAKWRFFAWYAEQQALSMSLVAGTEAPTGETHAQDNGVRLPPSLQPGSGAWNPFGALVATWDHGLFRTDGLLLHKRNGRGDQHKQVGDLTVVGLDVGYRFLHTQYPGPTASAKAGLQWRHSDQDRVSGNTVSSSGGDELRLRTGLGWHPTPAWDVTLSYEMPLRQDVHGTQLVVDHRASLAVGLRF